MHIVIIGNGITGISCARHIRKLSDHRITVISAESEHFYSRTALMYIYMGHMRYEDTKPYEDWFWPKNRIELVHDYVEQIDTGTKTLGLKGGSSVSYDKLVIATGSSSNKFGWPGQDLAGVQGLYDLQDLENMETYTKNIDHAVIVGGGLIGIEMAEMLLSREIGVTMLVRESSFWNNVLPPGESDLINRHIREHHIDLQLSTELDSIEGGKDGRVEAVLTKDGKKIACQFVGLTVGVHPNISFLEGSGIETEKGVLVDRYLQTNVDDVYAAGDCAQFKDPLPGRRPVEQIWYTGKMQGISLAHTICRKPTPYEPGIFFNSAKFFDIEYQTYGTVPASLPEGQGEFYWEHSDGNRCIHLVYEKEDQTFKGINTLGVRYRHDAFNQFLSEAVSVRTVIEQLPAANFDPEFYDEFEYFLRDQYNKRYPENPIHKKRKRGLASWFQIQKSAS